MNCCTNKASRLLSVDNQTQNGQHKYAYLYDKVGNRTSMMVTAGGVTRTHVYTYDNIYQVTGVDYPPELSYLATDTTFSYDAAGNRTSVIDGSGTCDYTSNNLNQYTAAGTADFQYDDSGNMTYDERFTYQYDPENRLVEVKKSAQGPEDLSNATDTDLVFTTGGSAPWFRQTSEYYYDGDAAQSGAIGHSQESWMQTTITGSGMLSFSWWVSSEGGDYLRFYVDDELQREISGNTGLNSWVSFGSGTHTVKWVYVKNGAYSDGSDCGWVDHVVWAPSGGPPATLGQAMDSGLDFTTGGTKEWIVTSGESKQGMYSARSGYLDENEDSYLQTQVEGPGTVKFWWKVSSEEGDDYLEFWLDGVLHNAISGSTDWEEKSFTLSGTGTHTFKWCYVRSGSTYDGDDCGYVDWVQWEGSTPPPPAPEPDPDNWRTLQYRYDAAGRRVTKVVDGQITTRYVYDGDHCIAEYDVSNGLRRKYIYGPGVDEPISMIEAAGSYAGTYYYHFDGLGSVVALTSGNVDHLGETVQVYEYDVYGRVGASVPAHPNRFMFTGREYDKETGLYYYRARDYNPQIGRFLQTDPVGYEDGVNVYRYCRNNPLSILDPSGKFIVPIGLFPPGSIKQPDWSKITQKMIDQGLLPDKINYPWDSLAWYLEGDGAAKEMGSMYLAMFQDSKAFKKMIWEIETAAPPYKSPNLYPGQSWSLKFSWTDVSTAEIPYNYFYNETFGTIDFVDANVVYTVDPDGSSISYTAQFSLKDTYSFKGFHNIGWWALRLIGRDFTGTGGFTYKGKIRLADTKAESK